MFAELILLVGLIYTLALFGGAAWVQRYASLKQERLRRAGYALALGVYCTSWTYYGAVGTAASSGWSYLPIYLGPMLLFLFAPNYLRTLVRSVQETGANSLSDFIASRFAKSKGLAALVTILALVGTIPYLALQLRSVGVSYQLLTGEGNMTRAIMAAALGLALFAVVFGARHYETGKQNEGVQFAVAAESLIKIVALCTVGLFSLWLLWRAPAPVVAGGLADMARNFAPAHLDLDFPIITLLSLMAFTCLPRQFYVTALQAREPADVDRARIPFLLYLLVTVVVVVPVATAGLSLLPATESPDFYVLSLPRATQSHIIATLVFLGGVSAAAAMAVTESIALSTMVANDLVAPLLLRRNRRSEDANLGGILLAVRRITIIALMAGAALYAMVIPANAYLASVGLIAFAGLAQIAPWLLHAVYLDDGDPVAAKAGLATGFLLWGYTLFLPSLGLVPAAAGTWFSPVALLGLDGLSPVAHGTLWSLGGNVIVYALVAVVRISAPPLRLRLIQPRIASTITTMAELVSLVERFVGPEETAQAFAGHPDLSGPVDRASARQAERLIANVVGASSAHAIMASVLSGASLGLADIADMLDASSQSSHFSRGLLAATLENIAPGVSVIDPEQRLIAWNSRYLELFNYPPGLVRIGTPVADLIRYNAVRGDLGPGGIDDQVQRRLDHLRSGAHHSFERRWKDGRVIKTVGGPMPDGGYVMCFTDITAETRARESLEQARTELEQRVDERTAELSQANEKLAVAIADKTRFLAAASHDLLQPLHAARLFAASLKRELPDKALATLNRVDRSIEAANDLLRALLDISKLDAGGITPKPQAFALRSMLAELVESFEPLAAERGLQLALGPGDADVFADRTLLRSIVQNFLSNAVRYAGRGGIMVGVRRRGGTARIEVYDQGPGIPADKQDIIFREFERLGTGDAPGIGLGLAIVERTARLIGAQIDLRSVPGRGSRFAVSLSFADGQVRPALPAAAGKVPLMTAMVSRTILIVDDTPDICDAMELLLTSMGHRTVAAQNGDAALARLADAAHPFDAALVDFNLGRGMNGLDLIAALHRHAPGLRAALVTAERGAEVEAQASALGITLLPKPLDAGQLQLWLAGDWRT